MGKLIEAVKCADIISEKLNIPLADLVDVFAEIPTAEVKEVRHGYWEEWWDDNYFSYCHKCSECGSYPLTKEGTMHDEVLSNFCPNCGAKMDVTPKERGGE